MTDTRFRWWAMFMIFALWLKVDDTDVLGVMWAILMALSLIGFLRACWLERKGRGGNE
jgi:hypothetical protein